VHDDRDTTDGQPHLGLPDEIVPAGIRRLAVADQVSLDLEVPKRNRRRFW
jgi:hypothetical protein